MANSTPAKQKSKISKIPQLDTLPKGIRKQNDVDFNRYVENFQRFYDEGPVDGLLTEMFQNMYDAYAIANDLKGERSLQGRIEVNTADNTITVIDNAGGMIPEALENSFTDFEKSFDQQNFEGTGGFHGRGSAICLDFGKTVLIETYHEEEGRTKAIWTPEETVIQYPDEEGEKGGIEWFAEDRLDETGTRIEIRDVKDDYINGEKSFSDVDFVKQLIHRWWNDFVSQPNIEIVLNIDGEYERVQPIDLEMMASEVKEFDNEFENDQGVEVDMKLMVFDDKRPKPFQKLVVFNNHLHQTIDHYAPHHIEESKRMLAIVRTNEAMQKFEKDSHREYSKNVKGSVVSGLQHYVKSNIQQFATERFTGEKDNVSKAEKDAVNIGRAAFNRLAKQVESFEWISGTRTDRGPEPTDTPDDLYCKNATFIDSPKFKNYGYSQNAKLAVQIENPEDGNHKVARGEVRAELLYPSDAGVKEEDEVIKSLGTLGTGEIAEGELKDITFNFLTPDDSFDKGRYRVKIYVKTYKEEGAMEIPETTWFRLNIKPEPSDGREGGSGFKDIQYSDQFPTDDILVKYDGDSTLIINKNHPEYKASKRQMEDDELDFFGFDVALRQARKESIQRAIDNASDAEEPSEVIAKVQDDADKVRTEYHREILDMGEA